MQESRGICFVIAPIGDEGTATRNRSDKVFRHIIAPAAEELRYEPLRADQIDRPGLITHQVIEQLLTAAIVVADLSERNPNVFYELAVRHCSRQPVALIIGTDEDIPFDVADARTVRFDLTDPDSVQSARVQLGRQMAQAVADPTRSINPVTTSIDIHLLRESGSQEDRTHAQMLTILEEMRTLLGEASQTSHPARASLRKNPAWQEELTRRLVAELSNRPQGAIDYQVLGVPSTEVTEFARRIGCSWDVFEELVSALLTGRILWSQGAAGHLYLELTDLGRKLVP